MELGLRIELRYSVPQTDALPLSYPSILAEPERFELSVDITAHDAFPRRCIKPLCHGSVQCLKGLLDLSENGGHDPIRTDGALTGSES